MSYTIMGWPVLKHFTFLYSGVLILLLMEFVKQVIKYCIQFLHVTYDKQSLTKLISNTNKLQPVVSIIIPETMMEIKFYL